MTLAGDSPVRFSELEQQEIADYRPVNRCAMIALGLGMASGLALTHPVLCILPLTGAILAIVALRQFNSPENRHSGRTLAVMGLALCVLFGSWAVARESSRELRLYRQAHAFAENWFALLRDGKVQEAHQLVVAEEVRAAAGVSLQDHYAVASNSKKDADQKSSGSPEMIEMMVPPNVEFDNFYVQPIPKRLRELGKKARYDFHENIQLVDTGTNTVEVALGFIVSDERTSFPIQITLARNYKPGLAADWRVVSVSDPHSH